MRRFLPLMLMGCLLLAAGCVPRVQAYAEPQALPRITASALEAGDGRALPLRRWLPQNGDAPAAVMIAVHGFNDYSQAFDIPGHYLADKGLALYAYDQRGFGQTEERGIWAGRANLTGDLRQMVLAVKEKHPDAPLYLLGESMGGAVVINALAEEEMPQVDGAILSAPAVWGSDTMPLPYRMMLWTGAHTLPWMELSGRNLGILATDNIPLLRAMRQDPLIIKRTRMDAIYGIVQLMDDAFRNAAKVEVPLLLLYGMNDQVIPSQPILRVADTLTAPYKLVYYPQGFHMLMRDLTSEVVMDDMVAWLRNKEGMLPSGYDLNWRVLMAETRQ